MKIVNLEAGNALRMREGPDKGTTAIAYIPWNSNEIKFVGPCLGRWCKISYRGLSGWASRSYLDIDDEAAARAGVAGGGAESRATAVFVEYFSLANLPPGKSLSLRSGPGEDQPAAGDIPANAVGIEKHGDCVNSWCPVRYGALAGWVPQANLAAFNPNQSPLDAGLPPDSEDKPFDLPASPAPVSPAPASPAPVEARRNVKLYTIAGASAGQPLNIRAKPDDQAAIVAIVARDGETLEADGSCDGRWCPVRLQGLKGWALRRHLADERGDVAKKLRVVNLAIAADLAVKDSPAESAAEIGAIPSFARGIVQIGDCGKDWCHIRYLGLVGWVSSRFLAADPGS